MSKVKELFSDVRALNIKYKCLPLIIFAVTYIASPVDFMPELFYKSWLFYLDDMAVLIIACVMTYMEVFLNERNPENNEGNEGVYSAVRRNPVEPDNRRDTDGGGSADGDAVHDLLAAQFPTVGLPGAAAESSAVWFEPEPFVFEPAAEEQRDGNTGGNPYERQLIADAANGDCVQERSEHARPETFSVGDGNAIIW